MYPTTPTPSTPGAGLNSASVAPVHAVIARFERWVVVTGVKLKVLRYPNSSLAESTTRSMDVLAALLVRYITARGG